MPCLLFAPDFLTPNNNFHLFWTDIKFYIFFFKKGFWSSSFWIKQWNSAIFQWEMMESELLLVEECESENKNWSESKGPCKGLSSTLVVQRQEYGLRCTAFATCILTASDANLPGMQQADGPVACSGIHSPLSEHNWKNPPAPPQLYEVPHLLLTFFFFWALFLPCSFCSNCTATSAFLLGSCHRTFDYSNCF